MTEQYCNKKSCPLMSAGDKTTYLWSDGKSKPIYLPAKDYIRNTFNWIDKQFENNKIFPISENEDYPKNFQKIVSTIIKKMYRMYAHIYFSHFSDMEINGLESNINSFFKHLVFFIAEFKLLKPADMAPLRSILERFLTDDEYFKLMKIKKRDFH
ncbi:MOB kinase activator 1B, variant 2 [Bonamia ostreae]